MGIVSALAWPLAASAIVWVLRTPLTNFLNGISGRITKLSAFHLELELAASAPLALSPLLEDIRSQKAEISDSLIGLLAQVQSTEPADYAEIDLGCGQEWITSRLFIAATMLERMRKVKVLVFVDRTAEVRRRFVAVAPVGHVRWALAQQFPWLEAAWLNAYLDVVFAWRPSDSEDLLKKVEAKAFPWGPVGFRTLKRSLTLHRLQPSLAG